MSTKFSNFTPAAELSENDELVGLKNGANIRYPITMVRPKEIKAILSQYGTAIPSLSVKYNTLGGSIVWSRPSACQYVGNLNGAFVSGKTFVATTPLVFNTVDRQMFVTVIPDDEDNVYVFVRKISDGTFADLGLNYSSPFWITVEY